MNENDKNETDRSRREVVIFIGSLAAGVFGCGSGSISSPTSPTSPTPTPASPPAATGCVVRPALTEGPYFVDERLNRAIHLHFKIRTSLAGGGYEFTSQLFFDESVTASVLAQSPYSTKGQPDTSNARDGIYQGGGSQLLVTPAAEGSGYGVTFDLALQY